MQTKKEKKKIVVAESSSEEEIEVGESEADSGAEDDENGVEDAGDAEEESSEDEELKTFGNEINFSDKSFEELGIRKWFTKQLNAYVLTRTTPVQANSVVLPILQKLAVDPYGIIPVILTPTRELATQISDQFIAFGRPVNLQMCTVIDYLNEFNILDEADQLLDGPYVSQLKIIFQAMGKKRQTLLFSATTTSALTS
uniref:ATP-dependent RNA helicase n=1 Tax=Panagrolaimus sp. PS1159 TaxID=55785 RepID=A0AC35G3Y1_9BILA